MLFRFLALVLPCSFILVACTAPNVNPKSGDGDASAADASADPDSGSGTAAKSCQVVVECIGQCQDDACNEACLAGAPTPVQDAVQNLDKCAGANTCSDAACLQTKCKDELQTCALATPKPATKVTDPPPPGGSVPADLVGEWISFGVLYEFRADGSMSIAKRIGSGACVTTSLEKGTAVVTGNIIKAYLTEGTINICGKPPTDPYLAMTDTYEYMIENTNVGLVLRLVKKNCQYTDESSINFYCTQSYDRK
jgi:hypothetical protein